MIMRILSLVALSLSLLAVPALAQEPTPPPVDVTGRHIAPENVLMLQLDTGTVYIELFSDVAPRHAERISTLANQGFYDGTYFHRVIPGFMAQGGDPTGTGTGGSDMPDLPAEFSSIPHRRGIASMARAQDVNSANSQFFIMFTDHPDGADTWSQLDGSYTVWGRVIQGMEHVDEIATGEPPAHPTHIIRARTVAVQFPDLAFVSGPPDLAERAAFVQQRAASAASNDDFDPLFETDVQIDILSPVLNPSTSRDHPDNQ